MANPKADVEELMNSMLPFGQQMLETHGEFIPYGAAMTSSNEIVSVSGYEGNEQPLSQDIIDLLKEGFKAAAEKEEYIATALFF